MIALTPSAIFCALPTVKKVSQHPAFAKLGGEEAKKNLTESEKQYLALKKEIKPLNITKQEKSIEDGIREFFSLFDNFANGKITESNAKLFSSRFFQT